MAKRLRSGPRSTLQIAALRKATLASARKRHSRAKLEHYSVGHRGYSDDQPVSAHAAAPFRGGARPRIPMGKLERGIDARRNQRSAENVRIRLSSSAARNNI